MTQHINGRLPSERQNNLVIELLAQRRITGRDLQTDHVDAMNAHELTEWLKAKLNGIPTNEQRRFGTDSFRDAQQAEVEDESHGEEGASDPRDEQPTVLRGTLPPITVGRANEEGLSVFGNGEDSVPS